MMGKAKREGKTDDLELEFHLFQGSAVPATKTVTKLIEGR
jgi:hypothetical protein